MNLTLDELKNWVEFWCEHYNTMGVKKMEAMMVEHRQLYDHGPQRRGKRKL